MKNKASTRDENKSIYLIFQTTIQKSNRISYKIRAPMINIFDNLSQIPFIQIDHMDETKKI